MPQSKYYGYGLFIFSEVGKYPYNFLSPHIEVS
jgi:hypothetical protein